MGANKTKKIGKYEVLDVLGKGGMGIVYKARDNEIGRLVAIKMITSVFADDTDFLTRFRREAQSTGKLQHPNIVIVYDLDDHDGSPFLVMEFLEGESLESILRSQRPVSLIEKLDYIIQVCNGLQYAHQRSPAVIHRDIKPPNIMVLLDGTVKIVDFGIAHVENEHLTQQGQFLGSLQYMSPEQVNCNPIDCRTDVYSTGVLLFQLLTYSLPFQGKDTGSTLLKIINEAPPSLRNYLDSYPAELDEIFARVLAKLPEERYQSADDLAYDLGRVQGQLKQEAVVQHTSVAEQFIRRAELGKASEEVQEILKIDRQSTRGRELQREIQQLKARQQRSEQARQIYVQAQQASADRNFGKALAYLHEASLLDPENPDFISLRDLVETEKARQDRLREAVKCAESAYYAGDLTQALLAIGEAASLDENDPEVKALRSEIVREREERDRQNQLRSYLDEAQRLISGRNFTAAIEILQKAEAFEPNAAAVRELLSIATAGREQERHRKEVEKYATEIEDALNREDYVLACAKAQKAAGQFPDERGLLKLKALAEKQREGAEKRQYIEAQSSAARKLLENGQTEAALATIEAACNRFPNEPSLVSSLNAIRQTLELERIEARKNNYLQRARTAIRNKQFDQAISILESYPADHYAPEIADLLQFAHDEAASLQKQQRIQIAADQAQKLMASNQYEKAIEYLIALPREDMEEGLQVLLAEARRYVEEFQNRTKEVIETVDRLMRASRVTEAIRFIESQPTKVRDAREIREVLERARAEQLRIVAINAAVERIRAALALQNLDAATADVESCRKQYGESPELSRVAGEVDARKREIAVAAVQKALTDARTLLLAHSYSTVLELLDGVEGLLELVPEQLRSNSQSLRSSASHRLELQRAEELRRAQIENAEIEKPVEPAVSAETTSSSTLSMPFRKRDLDDLIQSGGEASETELADIVDLSRRGKSVLEPMPVEAPVEPTATQMTATAYQPPASEEQQIESRAAIPPGLRSDPAALSTVPEHIARASSIVEEPAKVFVSEAPATSVEEEQLKQFACSTSTPGSDVAEALPVAVVSPIPVVGMAEPLADSVAVSSVTDRGPELPAIQTLPISPSPQPPIKPQQVPERKGERSTPPLTAPVLPKPTWRLPKAAYLAIALFAIGGGVFLARHLFLPGTTTVRIDSVPTGVTVAVNGQSCVTPNCILNLRPGDYEVTGSLVGYANATHILNVEGGTYTTSLSLRPLETAISVNTNFTTGSVSLDGQPQVPLNNGQLAIPSVAPGSHEIKITSPDGMAKLRFETQVAQIPKQSAPLSSKDVSALVVASLAGNTHAFCNCDKPTDLAIDGTPRGALASTKGDLGNLGEGSHEFRLGQGEDSRSHIVKLEAGPSLRIFLNADRNVGTLVVQAGLDQAEVYVNGKQMGRTGSDGVWRSTLPVEKVAVRVQKAGYKESASLTAEIRKNYETGLSFALEPLKLKATLSIVEAAPNTTVIVDGRTLGQTKSNGKFSSDDLAPGKHVIELTAVGYKDKQLTHNFQNNETFTFHGNLDRLPEVMPPQENAGRKRTESPLGKSAGDDTATAGPAAQITSPQKPLPSGPSPVLPSAKTDAEEWAQLKPSEDIKQLNAFIEKYKTGSYVDQARSRVKQLQLASDRSAVLNTLKLYSAAYQHRKVDEMVAVWPSLSTSDRGKLSTSFAVARAIRLDLTPVGDPSISGDTATVTCTRRLEVTLPSGAKNNQSGNISIKLVRRDGKWLIDSVS